MSVQTIGRAVRREEDPRLLKGKDRYVDDVHMGAIPAMMNAVNDALAWIDAPPIEMPVTPEKAWRAVRMAWDE